MQGVSFPANEHLADTLELQQRFAMRYYTYIDVEGKRGARGGGSPTEKVSPLFEAPSHSHNPAKQSLRQSGRRVVHRAISNLRPIKTAGKLLSFEPRITHPRARNPSKGAASINAS